ncbi:hyaluronan and proteoglycan link protein 1 [Anolis carolinensis]|uniref:Hyaluronan and proteoglycan link protein 1 n=1 Tax=Anolis carolinensis TaxID=28377 RepID=G1KL49_ANOCA|nr:PREDICTED: hyaluronan and proteoglycan link protein 1 [Anolis carolinensis]XP_016846416.1 PREDICTED: hyaluronan and proteoglycan link protein 1 [Anolis carolinensis]|eukprot:XP_008101216.1 PREDICTED: hyaluronan and proteoglycan link protein 1 [Anolis carolinensis]
MKSLLFLVLISFCWADPCVANFTLEHDRIFHIHENGPRLLVKAEQSKVFSQRGGNITLPCTFYRQHASPDSGLHKIRIKWTKLTSDYLKEDDVYVEMGYHKKSYGNYQGRVSLKKSTENDVSLVITNIMLEDYGKYKCEVIEGLEDDTAIVSLNLEGIVFPYFPQLGRYSFNFHEAQQACLEQDAVIASFDQLYEAWRLGLDWCNAGWLNDGSVQYPITNPREPCGGKNTVPGIRNYGFSNKDLSRYDVFCFTSRFNGRFYYLIHPTKLTYYEAVHACLKDGAQIAKVGQMFAAWKLLGYDRCDAGWLADGSVRYPISKPRKRCSPTEAAVRFVGFPDKKHKLYGVYCFRSYQ